ncbi:MAG: hypothetical protein HFE63_02560 [Clostridiales bacterium]|nr:hypothetical protein [Clostridiales bacterium]
MINSMVDTKYIQGLVDAGRDVVIQAVNPATGENVYNISEAIVLRSGTHITLDGCILRLADGVYTNVFISEGAYDTPDEITDISIVGINGATLSGGEPNGLTEKTANKDGLPAVTKNTMIFFRNVHGFKISGLRISDPRYWGITLIYTSDGIVENIEFKAANNVPNQDGIDLRRGCHDIEINNITGSTGDDTVALTALFNKASEKYNIMNASPDIYNVKISNISAEVTGGHGIIRLLCQDGIKMHDISISNVYDRLIDTKLTRCQAAVRLGDMRYWTISQSEVGDMYDITIDGVTTNAPIAVKQQYEIPGLVMSNIVQVK